MNRASGNKQIIQPPSGTLRYFYETTLRAALKQLLAADATVHMCHLFGDFQAEAITTNALPRLVAAMLDVERRDSILISSKTSEGDASQRVANGPQFGPRMADFWANYPRRN